MGMNLKEHWEAVYRSKRPTEVSWYQAEAALSTRLIRQIVAASDAPMIDVGGGASVLAAELASAGYTNLTVLDLSGAAIAAAQARLGLAAQRIRWIEADILSATLPPASFAFWHDRAVYHFLTDPVDRSRYLAQVRRSLRPGGHLLVATFAEDGPAHCSGLEVMRYSPTTLHAQFGSDFAFLGAEREEHRTPSGVIQAFTYCLCRHSGSERSAA